MALNPEEAGLLRKKCEKLKVLCRGIRRDLKDCLLDTDCVKIDKKSPRTCLNDPNIPHECTILAKEFYECRRQYDDMRKRYHRENKGY